jgi:hypothetical protein
MSRLESYCWVYFVRLKEPVDESVRLGEKTTENPINASVQKKKKQPHEILTQLEEIRLLKKTGRDNLAGT